MNKYVYGKCRFSIVISCRYMSSLQYVILLFSFSKWFQFRKVFFQTYFLGKNALINKILQKFATNSCRTISFLVVSCHKWLAKKSQNKTGLSLYYFPATSTPQFRWLQMTSVRVFFLDSSFSYCFLVAFRLFLLWLNHQTRILPWLSRVGSFFMCYY